MQTRRPLGHKPRYDIDGDVSEVIQPNSEHQNKAIPCIRFARHAKVLREQTNSDDILAKTSDSRERRKKDERKTLCPSEYLQLMQLSTVDRLLWDAARPQKQPPIDQFVDIAENTNRRDCAVPVDQPIFGPFPGELIFQNYVPFRTYRIAITFRNNDKVRFGNLNFSTFTGCQIPNPGRDRFPLLWCHWSRYNFFVFRENRVRDGSRIPTGVPSRRVA